MFVESSTPSPEGVISLMISPNLTIEGVHCLEFYYHMWGATTGRLSIYRKYDTYIRRILWRMFGNQGNAWRRGEIEVEGGPLQLVFETREAGGKDGYQGDMAIDDVLIIPGKCKSGWCFYFYSYILHFSL